MDDLIKEAKNTIDKGYTRKRHAVGAALKSKSGKVYTGICINSQRVDICAEWGAISKAFSEGDYDIIMSVAVKKNDDGSYEILPPCSLCRELFITYCPETECIVNETEKIKVADLLPYAYKKPSLK